MRLLMCLAGFLIAQVAISADESALVPAPLNSVLHQIAPGMKKEEIAKVLAAVYPKVVSKGITLWSGHSGYIAFVLDERFRLEVSAETTLKDDQPVVQRELLFYIFDNAKKRRVEIRQFFWEANEKKG